MNHPYKPESLMMSYGYNPHLSEGALKCPIFQTSTFVFKSAEEGKSFFELAYGLRKPNPGEQPGLIYSRLNNPDLEILEDRLTLWDQAEEAAVFESGMSAISTVLLTYLRPGDVVLVSSPLYGGTDHFIKQVLTQFGITWFPYKAGESASAIFGRLLDADLAKKVRMVYIETPANPTNQLFDIAELRILADQLSTFERPVLVAVDNTYMGPVWQHPLKHGAHLVLYSATKYIGGHSDVIAGAVLGSHELMKPIKGMRTFLGNMAGPWTGWLLLRSLETLKVRMDRQAQNALVIAEWLNKHPLIKKVHFAGLLRPGDPQHMIFKKQCEAAGAMLSFEVQGGEREAFAFLNSLKLIHLAVSLGGTESLAEHPASMTHIDLDEELKQEMGITDALIRLSVGVEDPNDIIHDLDNALKSVNAVHEMSTLTV
jgi:methionine-gamma-lyase